MSKPKILYVDDEAVNLSAFASLLRRKYTVLTAERVSEAFALLNAHPDVQVIVADERMPEQRGILFLEEVKQRMPESIRILLTAFADSGINLELGFWVGDPENGTGALRSDISLAIWRGFKAAGISIPFPQREVRILNPANGGQ